MAAGMEENIPEVPVDLLLVNDPRMRGESPGDHYEFTDRRIFRNPHWRGEGLGVPLPKFRVKLMTGISNIRNYIEFGLLDPKATTFAHLLKKEGYAAFCEMSGTPVPEGIDGKSLMATLKGGKKKHRPWIHIWYSRNGINRQAKQFVRNQRYKLYGDGRFFDVEKDMLEKSPLSEGQRQVRSLLKGGLDHYGDKRPVHLGKEKAKGEKKQ